MGGERGREKRPDKSAFQRRSKEQKKIREVNAIRPRSRIDPLLSDKIRALNNDRARNKDNIDTKHRPLSDIAVQPLGG